MVTTRALSRPFPPAWPLEQIRDHAIFQTDPDGRATTWNQGVRHVLGFEEEEFVGADITSTIFTPEDVASGIPEKELADAAREGIASNDR
jgi:PAS domain-containing protein